MNQNSQTLSSAAADEAAVRSLYQQLMDGWNAAIGDAFAAPFEEDCDLVGFDGTHIKGRQEIASFHQHLFDISQRLSTCRKSKKRALSDLERCCNACCRWNSNGRTERS